MRRLILVALAAAIAVPAASARPFLGVLGAKSRFQALTGQRSTVGHVIIGWNQGFRWGRPLSSLIPQYGPMPMLGIGTSAWPSQRETITPMGIALGQGDAYLYALNRAIAQWGRPIYLRPFGEMNGHWNPYCAYTASGRAKDGSHSTAWFRKAFAPAFIRAMAKFVKSHRRVELLSWFNGQASGGTFDIATKPRSRAAYRSLITPLGG